MKKITVYSILFVFVLIFGIATSGAEAGICVDLIKEGPDTITLGETIEYKFTIVNCGDVPCESSAQIYDPLFGWTWQQDLFPGESAEVYRSYTPTEAECGNFVNEAIGWCMSADKSMWWYDYADWTVYVDCDKDEQPGTGTPGYWKNHANAWPVDEITVCNVTYGVDDAINYMSSEVSGDKTITMFKALVAAKLNVLIGNDDSCISGVIVQADSWMCDNGPVGSGIVASSDAWGAGEPLYELLDLYNNGELCAPERD